MAGFTPRGAPYPDGSDIPDGPAQILALAQYVDYLPGISTLTYAQINAQGGAALFKGRVIYQTDTGADRPYEGLYTYNGVNWRLPWNQPWGLLYPPASIYTAQSGIVSYTTVTGLPVTFNAVANRYTKITFTAQFHNSTAGEGALAQLLDGATQIASGDYGVNSATNGHINLIVWVTFGAGSHTITPQVAHGAAGTVNLQNSATNPAQLSIEDLGPAGSPT